MSDLETQIGAVLSIAEDQLKTAADHQRETAATLANLQTQIATLAGLGPKLSSGVKIGASEAAKAAVLETAGDLNAVMDRLRATAAGTKEDLAQSVTKFQQAWGRILIGGTLIYALALLALAGGAYGWGWYQVQSLQTHKEALQADVATLEATQTDLERRGRRLVWNTCGGRTCFEVAPNDPGTWRTNGIRLAIPLATR
jgi:hypothetical protein